MATRNKPRLYIGIYENPTLSDEQQWTLIVSAKSQRPPYGRAKKFFVAPETHLTGFWGQQSWAVDCVDVEELSEDPGLVSLCYVGKIACGLTAFEDEIRSLLAYGRIADGTTAGSVVATNFTSKQWLWYLLYRTGPLQASDRVAYLAPWKTIEATVVHSTEYFKAKCLEKPESVVGVTIPVFDAFVADGLRIEDLFCGLVRTPTERRR